MFSPSYVQAAVTMPKIHGKGVYFLQQRFCQKPKICSSVLLIELSLPILGQFGKINPGKNMHHLQGRFELAMKPCPPQARLSWSTARADSLVTTTWAKIYFFFTTTCAKIFLFFRFEHLYLYRTGQCMKRRKIGKVALLKLSLSTILKLWMCAIF